MKIEPLDLASERIKNKGIDLWYDKPFVKILVKKVQELDPNIGVIMYPETKMVVFLRDKLIVYKLYLDEHNTTKVTIEQHIEKIKNMIDALDRGLIFVKSLKDAQKEAKKLNIKRGKTLN
jgi:hypothetical protein